MPSQREQSRQLNRLIGGLLGATHAPTSGALPWSEIRAAVPANVLPFLGFRLRQLDLCLPDDVDAWFATVQRSAAVRHAAQMHVVNALSRQLAGDGVPFAWLKGVAAAQLIYPNPALRPMQDLDLWVRREDVAAVERVVTDLGLLSVNRFDLGVPDAAKDLMFATTGPARVVVEVHKLPFSLHDVPETIRTAMFERRTKIPSISGGYALAPGDMILHTCLHLARHHRFTPGFLPLLDLALCVEVWGDSIPWDEWIRTVQEIGAASVWLPLELSRRYLGAQVPDNVMQELAPDRHAADLIELAEWQLVSTQEFPAGMEALFGGWSDFRAWLSHARATTSNTREMGLAETIGRKLREYRQRISMGQIPKRGWISAIRRARGRSRLRRILRETDSG